MIGQKWESEIHTYKDEKTGRKVKKLTSHFNNIHLYFTENSFVLDKNEILFYSDRAKNKSSDTDGKPAFNLFSMNLDSGEILQLSEDNDQLDNITKTPDSEIIVYLINNKKIKLINTVTGKNLIIYEEKGNYRLSNPSISQNKEYLAFCRNEDVNIKRGPNYAGFKDSYYNIKDGRITLLNLASLESYDIYRDTHWINHFQFCPTNSSLGIFCHEGPWNLVTQRMWLINFISHEITPCFRQNENDSVGHEFWTNDGAIFFDNRGPGHDGTITSKRTQAVATDIGIKENIITPYIGLIDTKGNLIKKMDMPYYCNHYHSNPHNTKLVGDDVEDLVLIDISGDKAKLEVLCSHKTSWLTKRSHCHPTWSWDGRKILYASDNGGNINLYLVEV
jgi:oligogalacturonide lyase